MLTKVGKLVLARRMMFSNRYLMVTNEEMSVFSTGQKKYFTGNADGFVDTSSNRSINTSSSSGVYLGTGTGVPSEDDYDLFNRITGSSIFSSSQSRTYSCENEKFIFVETFTITNISNQSFTITEIGAVQQEYCASQPNNESADRYYFLLEHSMLAEPLTLAPGDIGVIEWRREFDFTNFYAQN